MASATSQSTTPSSRSKPSSSNESTSIDGFFRAPKFIRVLFDTFPLYTYPIDPAPTTMQKLENSSPRLQNPRSSSQPTLYMFGLPGDSEDCAPSFNPACLKWQTYLKIRGVEFQVEISNNHASPSGSLPFLFVESNGTKSQGKSSSKIVPASKLAQWIEENADGSVSGVDLESPDCRAFMSLIDTNIFPAWLYALYVENTNLRKITVPNYTQSTPIWPVNYLLGLQMRDAALEAIPKASEDIKLTGSGLYEKAEASWAALSSLLGKDRWFFGGQDAGLFDASVFAYTHLILKLDLTGGGRALAESIIKYSNLVGHEERIRRRWYN